MGAVINILDFGVSAEFSLKARSPKVDPELDQSSGFSIFICRTRPKHVPLLLLCGDFEKKVSIAKQKKTNSEAEMCLLSNCSHTIWILSLCGNFEKR